MRALIAVDLKNNPGHVLAGALPWLIRTGAVADLLYSDEQRPPRDAVQDLDLADQFHKEWKQMCAEDERDLGVLMSTLPPANRGKVRLGNGSAANSVVTAAPDYDVVIVATTGRTGIAHFWLGSVAEQIVRASPRPVLVLRLAKAA